MKYHQVCELLKLHGYQFWRFGKGSHQIWKSITGSDKTILVSRSGLGDSRAQENFRHQLQKVSTK